VGQIDGSGPLQLGVWDVATGDRFLPDMAIPVAGDEIQRLIFAPDSGRLQVECRTCAWHVPINRDAADMAPADLTADVELATGMTIDRERDGALMPIDLREAWQRRSGSAAARSTPANAQGIELARRSLAAGDDFAGAYWLGQAIALRPDSPAEWHLLLAKAYLSRGQSKAARAAAQNAARAAAQQAEAQGRDSEVDNDVGAFSRPVQTQVEAMLGLAAFADQDWPEAIANLERASAAHGADSRWLRALAFAYAEVGARERARDTLERAIESGGDDDFSDDLEVATRKGRLRMQLLIWDHAIQTGHTDWWEEVLLPAQIHAQRGRVLIHLEAWSEGIADFDAAIARGADVPWVRTLRSFAREQLGKAEAATQGLETIDPP
jgi:tetratricopeptide (TPR) repeat protein